MFLKQSVIKIKNGKNTELNLKYFQRNTQFV